MKKYLFIFGLILVVGLGCSHSGSSGNGNDDISYHEISLPDYGQISDSGQQADEEISEDVTRLDDRGTDETDVGIKPGTKGWPCTKNDDCNSGFCVQTPNGRQCTNNCNLDSDCDPGFSCAQVQPPPDVIYACIYRYPNLCLPCVTDNDCKSSLVTGTTLCVAWVPKLDQNGKETGEFKAGYGIKGTFCGGPCIKDGDCPDGYVCRMAHSIEGKYGTQCIKETGSCGCTSLASKERIEGSCFNKNEFGMCQGKHRCTESGMTPCDAYVPTPEQCNGVDDDCDGQTDEDYQPKACKNTNAYGSCPGTTACIDGEEVCTGQQPMAETCDGKDDNCNGETDEEGATNCKTFYLDQDHDGYGLGGDHKCLCAGKGDYTATKAGDCNDGNPNIHPGATEQCNGLDDDCDSVTDPVGAEGCKYYYKDADGDGHGDKNGDKKCLCKAMKPFVVTTNDDCNDNDPKVNPDQVEICNYPNGIDDNCDGITDPEDAGGCTKYFFDGDQDGYGDDKVATRCLCRPGDVAGYTTTNGGDCDDNNNKRSPGLKEKCNDGIDNNCNGQEDEDGAEGCTWGYKDNDHDGWGGEGRCMCTPVAPYTCPKGGDCDDDDPLINPGAREVCGNSVDEDCSGDTNDVGASGCKAYYLDHDDDGYGVKDSECLCIPKGEFRATKTGDCNDNDPLINPGMKEVCNNSIDENCSGETDEPNALGCRDYYYDGDKDGYGRGRPQCLCKPTADFNVTKGGDCDDTDKTIHPNAQEICDGKDNDCNPSTPPDPEDSINCKEYYPDQDKDGFGSKNATPRCLCHEDTASGFTTLDHSDCNDKNKDINPNAKEVCNSGAQLIDENCNGETDEEGAEQCKNYYFDKDGDGQGIVNAQHPARCLCHPDQANLYRALNADDCNDNNKKIGQGFPEYCDGIDNNCNDLTDENPVDGKDYYVDLDGDHFGTGSPKKLCAPDYDARFTALKSGDCDDNNPDYHPDDPNNPPKPLCGGDGNCDGKLLDPGEECDDGNSVSWDGCTNCKSSEFRINQVALNDQDNPDIASCGNGKFIAVWTSASADSSGKGVVARLFDSSMKFLSNDVIVNSTTNNDQKDPAVAAINTNSAVVAWQSAGQDGDLYGIYGQLFDGSLNKTGDEFLINQVTTGSQYAVSLVGCGNQGWVAAYTTEESGSPRIKLRLFQGATAKTNAIDPDEDSNRKDYHEDVAWINADTIVVVWEAQVGPNDYDCFARVLTLPTLGASASAPHVFRINQFSDGYQTRPRITALKNGGFLVTWVSVGEDGDKAGVIARRYGADLLPKTGDIIVNTTQTGSQFQPDVTQAGDGFFVVWTSENQDGSSYGVYGRRYGQNNSPLTQEIGLNQFTSDIQWRPRVAGYNNRVITIWSSHGQDGSGVGVFARPYTF